jgi:hypothetical protein
MPIIPDDKNWTWVLDRQCPECGFDGTEMSSTAVPGALRENAAVWPDLLARPDASKRPSDDKWSALEYGCHVRDVFVLYDRRLSLMLEQDNPDFENWDQDKTAIDDRYHEQDPAQVSQDLLGAAAALADRFDTVTGEAWSKTGHRSDGSHFTVDTFARYLLHDPVHHVHDVETGYEQLERNRQG